MIGVEIDGRSAQVPEGTTVLLAAAAAGLPLTGNVGCMGQGVCGACRALVRRDGAATAETVLACETRAEDGMRVSFLDRFTLPRQAPYDETALADGWAAYERMLELFPNAQNCRHCSGCDRACPKGLSVQTGVMQATSGDFGAAAETFALCVMCNLCAAACPESIAPNHVGLFARRALAASQRPTDLIRRLHQIETGAMAVETTP